MFEETLVKHWKHRTRDPSAVDVDEREDRLEDAILLYERTLAGSNGRDYARAGLDRVTSRLRAERQLDRRYPPDSPVEAAN